MKKLDETAILLEKLEYKLHRLVEHGFVRVQRIRSSSKKIWINYRTRVVVKQPYHSEAGARSRKLLPHKVPTLMFDIPGIYGKIVIQPLVNVRHRRKALKLLTVISNRLVGWVEFDPRESNVGWYRRKPVLIDW